MAITTAFDLFYRRLYYTGSANTTGTSRATAGYFVTESMFQVEATRVSQSYLNFPSDAQTGNTYITTRTGSTYTVLASRCLAVPWNSPAADFLWNCTVPLVSESKHQTTYITASLTYNYTSSKWTNRLDSTASFFWDHTPSTQSVQVYGQRSYNITSSWHVVDGKFLSPSKSYPTGGHWHYCTRDSRINATLPSNTSDTFIGSNPDYDYTAALTFQLLDPLLPSTPFPDQSNEAGYDITYPDIRTKSSSSIYGGYFDRGGGAGITQTLISKSFVDFSIGVALTASNATVGFASMSKALKQRRLFFPTPVSASGTNKSEDYWFKQFSGQKAIDLFNDDGGIYNVQFTIKRFIGGTAPYSSSLYQPPPIKPGQPLPEPYTIYFYKETNNYYPTPGSYLNVFISDVQTTLTSSVGLSEGVPGWYPPENNIIVIGNGYGPSPIMSFYDTSTGYQLERFNINVIQYGYPAQLCFEPSGDLLGNSYFGCIIDDVNMCKIGTTRDSRFTKAKTIAIKTAETTTAVGNLLGQSTGTFTICCFTPDTLITMYNGSVKKIKDVIEGDVILGYDEANQCNVPDTVVSLVKSSRGDIVTYTLEDDTLIEATPDHPIFVPTKGWSSADPSYTTIAYDMDVKKIEIGDSFLHNTGTSKRITDISWAVSEPSAVYTFGTEIVHNYYANGFLAHNMPKLPGWCSGSGLVLGF